MHKFNLSRAATIALHEYVTSVRRPSFIFFTLLPPAIGLIGLIVAVFFSGQTSRFFENQFVPKAELIGIVDQSGLYPSIPAAYSAQFAAYPNETAAQQALNASTLGAFVVIPANYVKTGNVTVYVKEGGFLSGAALADSSSLTPFLVNGLLAGKVDEALIQRVSAPAHITPVTLGAEGQPSTSAKANPFSMVSGFVIPYMLSIFLVIAIFTTAQYLLRSVSEEKETRVIEVVLSSVTAQELLAGKVVGLGALGFTQLGVWLGAAMAFTGGVGALLAGAVVALNPMVFVLSAAYFLLGYLMYGTLMAAAGALGTNVRESQQMAGLFSFTAFIPYMLSGFIWMNPNMPLARALSYFPLTAPTMMMFRLPYGVPPEDIVISLVVLLVSVPFCVWGGAKVFRTGLLMYGKRPSLRQIWRILREA
jgi:ABC-2 type transport system permease protein